MGWERCVNCAMAWRGWRSGSSHGYQRLTERGERILRPLAGRDPGFRQTLATITSTRDTFIEKTLTSALSSLAIYSSSSVVRPRFIVWKTSLRGVSMWGLSGLLLLFDHL
jgi:hypothetical protein